MAADQKKADDPAKAEEKGAGRPRPAPVGAPVQYFSAELADPTRQKFTPYSGQAIDLNRQGAGPYAAIVVQANDDGTVNLRVFGPIAGDWIETGVPSDGERRWQHIR